MFRIRLFGENKWGPFQQGVLVVVLSLLMGVITRLSGAGEESSFVFIVSPMLLYCSLNPVLSVFAEGFKRYFIGSLIAFGILITFNYWVVKWMTGLRPFDNSTMSRMYVLMGLYYFIVYTAAMLFRGIRIFLEKNDQMR
jgi:hypothetical protein